MGELIVQAAAARRLKVLFVASAVFGPLILLGISTGNIVIPVLVLGPLLFALAYGGFVLAASAMLPKVTLDPAARTVRIRRRVMPAASITRIERKSRRMEDGTVQLARLHFERRRPVRVLLEGTLLYRAPTDAERTAFASLVQLSAVPARIGHDSGERDRAASAAITGDGRAREVSREQLVGEATGTSPEAATSFAVRLGADASTQQRARELLEAWARDEREAEETTGRLRRTTSRLLALGAIAFVLFGVPAVLLWHTRPGPLVEWPTDRLLLASALLAGCLVSGALWLATQLRRRSGLRRLGRAWWDAADGAARERGIPPQFEDGWSGFSFMRRRRRLADEWVQLSAWRLHPPTWFEAATGHRTAPSAGEA